MSVNSNLDAALDGLVSASDKFRVIDIIRHHGSIDLKLVEVKAVTDEPECSESGSGIFYPAVSADDGYGQNPNFYANHNYTFAIIGRSSWVSCTAFVRFVDVTIPQGSTITSAFIRFTCLQNQSGTVINTNIYFNDHDNAVAPTNYTELMALGQTTAFTAWDGIAAWTDGITYDTPSLIDELQEIVDRGGFSTGNAVIAMIYNDGSDNDAYRVLSSIDQAGGSEKAELHVEWTKYF